MSYINMIGFEFRHDGFRLIRADLGLLKNLSFNSLALASKGARSLVDEVGLLVAIGDFPSVVDCIDACRPLGRVESYVCTLIVFGATAHVEV